MKKNLDIVHPAAAGIDIGSRSFYVDAGEENIRVFPTFTDDCNALRDYLLLQKVTTVAMESTGVYRVVLYSVLEEAGIEVYLVNGRDVKNLPGRKSDVKDCQWLRQLHSYGLLAQKLHTRQRHPHRAQLSAAAPGSYPRLRYAGEPHAKSAYPDEHPPGRSHQ